MRRGDARVRAGYRGKGTREGDDVVHVSREDASAVASGAAATAPGLDRRDDLACDNADNQIAIAASGGIGPLVELLQTGTDDGKAQAAADERLRDLRYVKLDLERRKIELLHPIHFHGSKYEGGAAAFLEPEIANAVLREAATALLQSQGAHVRTSVTRFTDFVVAGPLLRDGRLVTEGSKYKRMVELNTRRPNTQQWAQLVMEPQLRAMVPKKAWAKARKETEARLIKDYIVRPPRTHPPP